MSFDPEAERIVFGGLPGLPRGLGLRDVAGDCGLRGDLTGDPDLALKLGRLGPQERVLADHVADVAEARQCRDEGRQRGVEAQRADHRLYHHASAISVA